MMLLFAIIAGFIFRPADWRPALATSSDLFNWKFDKLLEKLLRSILEKARVAYW